MSGPTFWTEEQKPRRVPIWVWLVGLPVLFLLTLVFSVPVVGVAKIQSNQVSAINSLRAIVEAESEYRNAYPDKGYSCTLQALGGDPGGGPPSPQGAELIQSDLAWGVKSGYVFNLTNCTRATVNNTERVTGYTVTAVPAVFGKSGQRGFCIDEKGEAPMYDPKGGTNCTQKLQ